MSAIAVSNPKFSSDSLNSIGEHNAPSAADLQNRASFHRNHPSAFLDSKTASPQNELEQQELVKDSVLARLGADTSKIDGSEYARLELARRNTFLFVCALILAFIAFIQISGVSLLNDSSASYAEFLSPQAASSAVVD